MALGKRPAPASTPTAFLLARLKPPSPALGARRWGRGPLQLFQHPQCLPLSHQADHGLSNEIIGAGGSNTESHCNESTTNHDKTNPPSGAPNGQNTESYSAPAKKRRGQNTGIPHRTRGRTADRGVQGQSPA